MSFAPLCNVCRKKIIRNIVEYPIRGTNLDCNPLFSPIIVLNNTTPDFPKSSFSQTPFSDVDLTEMDVRQMLDLCVDKRRTVELVVKNVSIAQNQMFTRMQITERGQLKVWDRKNVFVELLITSVSVNN